MDALWGKLRDMPAAITLPLVIAAFLILVVVGRMVVGAVTGSDTPPVPAGGGSSACQTEFDPTCEGNLEPRSGG